LADISGKICKKTSPKSAPAEKLTKYKSQPFSLALLITKVTAPAKEIILTIKTLTKEYIQI
jgi:hypothetical protein